MSTEVRAPLNVYFIEIMLTRITPSPHSSISHCISPLSLSHYRNKTQTSCRRELKPRLFLRPPYDPRGRYLQTTKQDAASKFVSGFPPYRHYPLSHSFFLSSSDTYNSLASAEQYVMGIHPVRMVTDFFVSPQVGTALYVQIGQALVKGGPGVLSPRYTSLINLTRIYSESLHRLHTLVNCHLGHK